MLKSLILQQVNRKNSFVYVKKALWQFDHFVVGKFTVFTLIISSSKLGSIHRPGSDICFKHLANPFFRFDIKHVTEDSDLQPCLVAFDLLYLNGKRLTSQPQCERLDLLRKILKPIEGRLLLAEVKQAKQNQEVCLCYFVS